MKKVYFCLLLGYVFSIQSHETPPAHPLVAIQFNRLRHSITHLLDYPGNLLSYEKQNLHRLLASFVLVQLSSYEDLYAQKRDAIFSKPHTDLYFKQLRNLERERSYYVRDMHLKIELLRSHISPFPYTR